MWKTLKTQLIAQYAFNHAENVVSVRDPHKPTDIVKALMKQSKELGHVIEQVRDDGSSSYFTMVVRSHSILIKCKWLMVKSALPSC